MAKIVYNNCYGGFSLSEEADELYCKLSGKADVYSRWLERDDPILVQVVEQLGEKANGRSADLKIIEIPAGTQWRIEEYDGSESVMSPEDYEWKVAK